MLSLPLLFLSAQKLLFKKKIVLELCPEQMSSSVLSNSWIHILPLFINPNDTCLYPVFQELISSAGFLKCTDSDSAISVSSVRTLKHTPGPRVYDSFSTALLNLLIYLRIHLSSIWEENRKLIRVRCSWGPVWFDGQYQSESSQEKKVLLKGL